MGHWAKLDYKRTVTEVIIADEEFIMSGAVGHPLKWIETCPDATFRKNFAGPGHYYDIMKDAFIPPPPYPSWVLDEVELHWKAPIEYPNDGGYYAWNEEIKEWFLVV